MSNKATQDFIRSLISYNEETGAFHQQVVKNFSSNSDLSNVSCVIPGVTYHPEIKVVIDFMSYFTIDFNPQGDTIAKRSRLVLPSVLLDRAKSLANFWAYYFNDAAFADASLEKTLEKISDTDVRSDIKGNQKQYITVVKKVLEKLNKDNEEEANKFINHILNMFITDIQIERNLKDIGNCSITFRDNIYQTHNAAIQHRDTLFFKSFCNVLNQLFSPMLPVSVWAKGRIYPTKWFPIFTGYIFQTTPADKEGFTTFTVICKDVLELARISTEMVNPALCVFEQIKKQDTIQLYSQPFYNKSMWEIATLMFQGGKMDTSENSSTGQTDKRSNKNDTTSASSGSIQFHQLANNIRVINQENALFSELNKQATLDYNNQTNLNSFLTKLRHYKYVLLWGEDVSPYKNWSFASPKNFTSQFTSRYEILKLAAQRGYLEFYADGAGNVRIHPMRLSNKFFENDAMYVRTFEQNTTKLPKDFSSATIITPHETLSSNKLFDIQNMATFLRIGGSPAEFGTTNEDYATQFDILGSYVDRQLISKYGFRMSEIIEETYHYNPTVKGKKGTYKFLDLAARELLRYRNGELYTRTTNIVFRPELELANPIYFTDSKEVFYVQSITHNISIGGSATTTINCNFGRSENELPPMLWDFIVAEQKMFVSGTPKDVATGNLAEFFEQELNKYPYSAAEADIFSNENLKWAGLEDSMGDPTKTSK